MGQGRYLAFEKDGHLLIWLQHLSQGTLISVDCPGGRCTLMTNHQDCYLEGKGGPLAICLLVAENHHR